MEKRKGTFQKQPEGTKTPRMLKVEENLGRELEEDYMEYYFNGYYGQKKVS